MPIYKGKTTEEAIENGLRDLGIKKDSAKIEVKKEGNSGVFGLFANEAEVDIRPLTEQEIKKQILAKKLKIIGTIVGIAVIAIALTLLAIFSPSSDSNNKKDSNLIALPIESKNITEQNYKTVVSQLKDAGFTNVKTEKIEDLITGWVTKDGQIESVSIQGEAEFKKGQEFSKNTPITVTYHTFKEDAETSSSSTEELPSSSTSSSQSSTPPKSSANQATAAITPENNPEFAAILQTEDPAAISSFVQKYKGKTVEFNAYIAYLSPHNNYKTRYDVLIYAGDYPGPDTASPGPSFQFNNVPPTTVFKDFSGDSVGVGQNMHIKATIREFTQGELLLLDPLEVTER